MNPEPVPAAVPTVGAVPASHLDLLERPLFGHLATVRPDGTPQVSPMWYLWDGETVSFTTTTTRAKHRNVTRVPQVALSIHDPGQPYRYLEVRGVVERVDPDPAGAFFDVLARRYGLPHTPPVADAPHRVVLRMRPTGSSSQ
jgi:PPOX class probable F420-dependent enzyme